MIIIALGSNLSGPWGNSRATVTKAIGVLDQAPCTLIKSSTLLDTIPFGKTDQPHFVNALATISTKLQPEELLQHLQNIEREAGRVRLERWGPRTLDLDIIDYNGVLLNTPNLTLPHPGIHQREFVLKPLAEIAPRWRHPASRQSATQMLAALSSS